MFKSRRVLAVGIALVGVLSGCSAQPGTAAVVDGEVITTSELAVALDEIRPLMQDEVSTEYVLTRMVQYEAIAEVTEEYDIEITDGEVQDTLNAAAAAAGVPVPTSEGAQIIVKIFILEQTLSMRPDAQQIIDDVITRLADLEVTVNPRFGTYSVEANSVLAPTEPAWIVSTQDMEAVMVSN